MKKNVFNKLLNIFTALQSENNWLKPQYDPVHYEMSESFIFMEIKTQNVFAYINNNISISPYMQWQLKI
jgi:hypothetical protein